MSRTTTTNRQSVFARPAALPVLVIPPGASLLPDLNQWIHRIEVLSAASGKRYVIAQHREKRSWACDCQGWRTHRTCKHLRELGLLSLERPYEVTIAGAATGAFTPDEAPAPSPTDGFVVGRVGREVYSLDDV